MTQYFQKYYRDFTSFVEKPADDSNRRVTMQQKLRRSQDLSGRPHASPDKGSYASFISNSLDHHGKSRENPNIFSELSGPPTFPVVSTGYQHPEFTSTGTKSSTLSTSGGPSDHSTGRNTGDTSSPGLNRGGCPTGTVDNPMSAIHVPYQPSGIGPAGAPDQASVSASSGVPFKPAPRDQLHSTLKTNESDSTLDADLTADTSTLSLATTMADNNFQEGLAQLDANIAKLQQSLRNSQLSSTL